MPNVVKMTVEVPDEILNAGAYGAGALIRLQTAATEAGAYSDVSGTGSTPTTTVVSGTRIYTGYDPNGTASTWYRTRFENAGGTRLSDWSDPFQVAAEGTGLLVSLWDVKQALGRTGTTDSGDDELILEHCRRVTDEILGYTGRAFLRIPAAGTDTFLLDVESSGRTLWVAKGLAAVGQLEVATQSQPESGGTYTVVPAADWFLRPTEVDRDHGWPATRIVITDRPTGGIPLFYAGYNTVRLTSSALGWPTPPSDVQGIAERAVVAAFISKGSGTGGTAVVGPAGGTTILRHLSPADRAKLDWYRAVPV